MTPPVLLTPPTLDTHSPLNADCVKRNVALPPLGVIIAHPPLGPSSTSTTPTTSTSSDAYYDSDASESAGTSSDDRAGTRAVSMRQWTGAPIRAIVPLPRRKLALPNGAPGDAAAPRSLMNVPVVGSPPCLMRCAASAMHFWDDADTDSGAEIEEEEEEIGCIAEGRGDARSGSRYCSYESITATEGLSARSFEELRVECYAQSLIARGTNPPPVVRPSLAIPPAFVPRIVPRN